MTKDKVLHPHLDYVLDYLSDEIEAGEYDYMHDRRTGIRSRQMGALINYLLLNGTINITVHKPEEKQ